MGIRYKRDSSFWGSFFRVADWFEGKIERQKKCEKKILTGQDRFDIVPILLQGMGREKLVFEN